jgi:hypothetical protein
MRPLIERVLSRLFPVKMYRIKTADEARYWMHFEAPNHHAELDPWRPMGPRDSWAGRTREVSREASGSSTLSVRRRTGK